MPLAVVNTLRPRQHGRHFADDTFKRIFLSENVIISIKISLKFVPKGPIHNIPALVQIMAWRRPDDKPLSEPMMVSLPTHICVTRPQWVNKRITFLHWNIIFQRGKFLANTYIPGTHSFDGEPSRRDNISKCTFKFEFECKPMHL